MNPPTNSTSQTLVSTWRRGFHGVAAKFSAGDPPRAAVPPLPWWAWIALVGLPVAVYLNSLPNSFHYDDVSTILRNPAVQHIERVPEHFWSVTIGKQEGGASYRPLLMASYGINYWWGKADPTGYHIVNIVLHAAASFLVALLVWNLSSHAGAAWLGGLVFALHPIHTEAVNYITARSSVLYGAAALAAVVAFIRFRAGGRVGWLALSVAAYLASLLAKEAAVIVPVLLIGYDVIIRGRRWADVRRWILPHAPFVALALGYVLFRQVMMAGLIAPAYHSDPVTVVLTFAAIVTKTLIGQLAPTNLSISHPFGPIRHVTLPALGAVATVAGLVMVSVLSRRRAPVLSYAATWFVAALLPLAPLTLMTTLALYQENRGYLSAAAVALVAGPLLAWVWDGGEAGTRRMAGRAGVLALLGVMAVTVVLRNPVWRDDVSLWRDALDKAPGNQAAYVNLGAAYQARGEFQSAADVYRLALERFPNNGMLYNNLGAIYLASGESDRAAEAFRAAIRVTPDLATPYFNLGLILEDAGARDQAAAAYRRFLELAPSQPGTMLNAQKARQRLAEIEAREP